MSRKSKFTPEQREDAVNMYLTSGQSLDQVGRMFGVTGATIAHWIDEWSRRPRCPCLIRDEEGKLSNSHLLEQ